MHISQLPIIQNRMQTIKMSLKKRPTVPLKGLSVRLWRQVLAVVIHAKSELVTCVVNHGPRYAAFVKLIYVQLLSASGHCIIGASSRGTVRSVQLLLTPWLCTSPARYFWWTIEMSDRLVVSYSFADDLFPWYKVRSDLS